MSRTELLAANEVFYSNSLWGIRPIVQLEHTSWKEHPVSDALFSQYREYLL